MSTRRRNVVPSPSSPSSPPAGLARVDEKREKSEKRTKVLVEKKKKKDKMNLLQQQPVWVLLAIASGACAAFNGVFAKLTTTELTSSLAANISSLLSLSPENKSIEFSIRGFFFVMNLIFNGVMWSLFTAALTRASSSTRVSIINVSTNFFITAMLGFVIFSEKLPPTWWCGAALLATGNVFIGRRDQDEKDIQAADHTEMSEATRPLLGSRSRSGSGNDEEGQRLDNINLPASLQPQIRIPSSSRTPPQQDWMR